MSANDPSEECALAIPACLGEVPRVVFSKRSSPLWLYPNLLSLDAPLVAVAWLYIFAKTWRLGYHPWQAYVSLGLVVWVIYVVDRLLDSSMKQHESERTQARHEFHRRHRKKFLIGVSIGSIAAVLLVVLSMPVEIYTYFGVGVLLIVAFFTLSIFSTTPPGETPYAKNIVAGFTFAYGTAMVAHAYTGWGFMEMLRSGELVCFAVLCILNITAIDLWEHASRSNDLEIKASDELSLTLPLTLLGAASLVFALWDHELATRPFFYATLTGAALLQILNRTRTSFSLDALRVLADVAVLAPFLIFIGFPRS